MDLDTTFPTMYKKIEEMYLNDPEFTPEIVYTLTENVYRQEMLVLFKLTEFNQQEINHIVLGLYETMKENEIVQQALSKMGYDKVVSFMILFSYDYFYLFYPVLKGEKTELLDKIEEIESLRFNI
jgi:hypothetical protein